MKKKKYLIVIGGATATGKTTLAIQLAKYYKADILSADSRQFYKEMSIGTAKPSTDELAQAPHHFINSLSVHENYNVGDYEKDALLLLEKIYKKQDIAILVGGSGMYIQAVCTGLDTFPEVPALIQEKWEEYFQLKGLLFLQEKLKELDPVYYQKVDIQNPRRLLRALMVSEAAEKPFSSFQNQAKAPRFFHPIYFQLKMDRSILYERINRRVDEMIANGLVAEAKNLHPFAQLNALKTVGYQELFDYFDHKTKLPIAIESIKRNSRRYAKRQMTWFKNTFPDAITDIDQLTLTIDQFLH